MTTDAVDVLLVGGGVASVRCARALRRGGFDGSIRLLAGEALPPYNRPPLTKELLREDLPDDLVLAEPEGWYARRGIELRAGAAVSALDAEARVATLEDGSRISFDRCLLATGAAPRTLPIPGGERAMLLRTLPDARRLRAAALASPGAPVTVVGGGFIGVEVASGLAALGLRPTIVEMAGRLWGGALGGLADAWARERLSSAGIGVRLGATVERLGADAAWLGDERLEHAFVVAGVGVMPRAELAEAAGLTVDDGIVTDATQRTSNPAIWAAGDVARVAGRRVEHWHAAREGGERAALAMLGNPVPPPHASWVFSEVAGVPFDVIGDAAEGQEERWVRDGSVLAFLDGARVAQVVIVDSAIDPSFARDLVERGASVAALEGLLAAPAG